MNTSRRSFLSNTAKVAAPATLRARAIGDPPRHILTLTHGFEGEVLAVFKFTGYTIPVDPRSFFSGNVHDVVAVVTDSISGSEKFRHYCDYKDDLGNLVMPAITNTTHFAWRDAKRTPVADGVVEWDVPFYGRKYLCREGYVIEDIGRSTT